MPIIMIESNDTKHTNDEKANETLCKYNKETTVTRFEVNVAFISKGTLVYVE